MMCMDLMRGSMDACGEGKALFSLFAGVNEEREWKSPFLNQYISEITSKFWEQSANRTWVSIDRTIVQ